MFIIILVYSFIVSNFVFFLYTVLVCFPGKLLSLCGFQIGSIHNVPIMSLKICLFYKDSFSFDFIPYISLSLNLKWVVHFAAFFS